MASNSTPLSSGEPDFNFIILSKQAVINLDQLFIGPESDHGMQFEIKLIKQKKNLKRCRKFKKITSPAINHLKERRKP